MVVLVMLLLLLIAYNTTVQVNNKSAIVVVDLSLQIGNDENCLWSNRTREMNRIFKRL